MTSMTFTQFLAAIVSPWGILAVVVGGVLTNTVWFVIARGARYSWIRGWRWRQRRAMRVVLKAARLAEMFERRGGEATLQHLSLTYCIVSGFAGISGLLFLVLGVVFDGLFMPNAFGRVFSWAVRAASLAFLLSGAWLWHYSQTLDRSLQWLFFKKSRALRRAEREVPPA